MIKIREEQKEVFRSAMRAQFVAQVTVLARERYPERCAALGDDGLRSVLQRGIERAKSYDLWTQRDVGRYLLGVVGLGEGFEEDPRFPWAKPLLEDEHLPAEGKMDLFWQQAAVAELQAPGG